MKKDGQHSLFATPVHDSVDVPKGNKSGIAGGKDETPDRLPTVEFPPDIPSAPARHSQITSSSLGMGNKKR